MIEISISVYSVLTVNKSDDAYSRVAAYLYDHTTVVESHESDGFVFFIVKTTVERFVDNKPNHDLREPIDNVFYLANYQLGRVASGLGGGILAGSLDEARELLAEAVEAVRS